MKRKTVGIRALKDQLSTYVHRVAETGEVLITDRGRAVARLAPLEGAATSQERLRVRHAAKSLADLSWMTPRQKPRARASDVADALDFVRADREAP